MIELRGTMVDCPTPLQVGVEMIVSLNLYIKTSAFASPSTSGNHAPKKSAKDMLNEGQETFEEQTMRGRKIALNRMFKVLGLRPQVSGGASGKVDRETDLTTVTDTTSQTKGNGKAKAKPRTEIVGDGEEVEIDEDDEELNDNQLNVIYRK
jgi:DNA repair protein RAD5